MTPEPDPIQQKTCVFFKPRWRWFTVFFVSALAIGLLLWQVIVPTEDCLPRDKWCFSEVDAEIANQGHAELVTRAAEQESELYVAYSVNRCQFEAMQLIWCKNNDAAAVRLYPGIDPETKGKVFYMCEVSENEKDLAGAVYKMTARTAGLCPRYCDDASPILAGDPGAVITVDYGQQIRADEARQLVKNYLASNPPEMGFINSFCISDELFRTMEKVAERYENYEGFRIYFGLDKSEKLVLLVTAFNADNKDYTDIIFTASPRRSGLCPRYCDYESFMLQGVPTP